MPHYFNDPSYAPGATKRISLSGPSGSVASVTEAVPPGASGLEVRDYSAAFVATTVATPNGTLSLTLAETPVYVQVVR